MNLAEPVVDLGTAMAVLSAEEGRVLGVTAAATRIFGYTAEQVIGRLPMDIGLWPNFSTRAEICSQLCEQGRVAGFELVLRCADGRELACRVDAEYLSLEGRQLIVVQLRPLATGSIAVSPLAAGESYRSLYWHAAEGLYRSLPGAGLVDVNPAMALLFGFDSTEQMLAEVGRDVSVLYASEDDARGVREELDRFGVLRANRLPMRRRDGSRIWISENARAIGDEQGQTLFYEGSIIDVSAEHVAQQALHESEALYRALVQNCRDGVFLIQRGRLLFVNQALAEILGYTPGELVGTAYMNLVHPDDFAEQNERRQAREDGSLRAQRYALRLLHREGRVVSFEVHADALIYHGDIASTGVMRDITEEQRQRKALQQAEARYRELFQSSPVGLFRSTESGRFIDVNPALARMLRYPDPETMVRDVDRMEALYAEPEDRKRLLAQLRSEGRVDEFSTRLLGFDGNLIWAHLSVQSSGYGAQGLQLTGSVVDVSRQREAEHLLRFHANFDALTGLPNRWQFEQQLLLALGEAERRSEHDYAVLFLDLDGFKWVNDSLGHGAGDRLLVAIGERLSLQLGREILLARYGGDEFSLLPRGACSRERAVELAEQITALFRRPFRVDGQEVYSGASVGIVLGHPDYRWPEQILRDADTAMYRAKSAGKAGFVVFDDAMHEEAKRRFELQTDLRLALSRSEFVVHFQPIVELASGRTLGCEALVRWQHPRRGLLMPGEFLDLAEETSLIGEIDLWMLRKSCAQLANWRSLPGYGELSLSLNMDERLVASPNAPAEIRSALFASGLKPSRLNIEVTERVFRADLARTAARLAGLKATGAALVVDDFGTGYSSLDSFADSPFDALKIDRSFVRDMLPNPRHRAIVRTIVGFARDLGLSLTAEGVETEEQRAALLEMGCTRGQGYLFAAAMPAEQFQAWLQAREA